ncbi:chemotaxis protein CheA [Lutispora thermophila]|uniref:Chemotaxis protein CheA n=1 Tax=Lutispora thermophila DSM 19022 TaxID=1122184 RepID=A0A1M6IIJ2_9FIRM|nr:chemotaxis protein CheA [Lutispora thermophila]SHJ34300.1 two-component system, chemotaxis family, sensor kinase CheA [Lutispora thermophila DSM 19022]
MESIYDNPEMIRAFIDELEEQLQLLEENILELECCGESPDVIQEIFRVAHTLKGSSSAMGFEKMKILTHEMENVLDKIRNHHLKATKPVINVLFQCLDHLRLLKEDFLTDRKDIKTDTSSVLHQLEKIMLGEYQKNENADSKDSEESVQQDKPTKFILDIEQQIQIEQAVHSGYNILVCEVRLEKESLMKSARAYLIMNHLNQIGTVVQVEPDILENGNDLLRDEIYYLLLSQQDGKTIESKVINELTEIESIRVYPFSWDMSKQQSLTAGFIKPEADNNANAKTADIERKVNQTVRVDVERLEKMMDLVGELVIERTRIAQVGSILHERYSSDNTIEELIGISNQVSRVTNELQEIVLKTRMLPIKQLFGRFPRLVRDLAEALNKEVKLIMEGEETELDKTIIEDISDPLIHIIRNAVDHGIESPEERIRLGKPPTGTLHISAYHQENNVILIVQDDGAGIDLDKVKESAVKKQIITAQEAASLTENEIISLIFYSGFSTSSTVNDISGRGVGMDIVKNHVDKLNGIIEVETKKGEGTKFIIKLPLTLAILTGLLVRINDEIYALPMSNVIEIVRKPVEEIETVKGQAITVIRDRILPLVWLHDYFKIPRKKKKKNNFIVVLGVAEKRLGLVVDELVGNQEIVVKPLGSYIGKVNTFSGATILGDGSVACILDVAGVAKMVGSIRASKADEE